MYFELFVQFNIRCAQQAELFEDKYKYVDFISRIFCISNFIEQITQSIKTKHWFNVDKT